MDYEFPHRTQRSRRKICFDIFCHTKKYCGPGFFPRRNLMKLFFPNQKRQQIALAKNQDGARGDDLPNQHKTGTLDCPRRNFAKLFFQSNKYSKSCLRTSRTAPAGMIYEIKRRLRSRIFSKRILAKMIFPNQQRQQVVVSTIQDGGRGNDLPDKEMTAAQDFFPGGT